MSSQSAGTVGYRRTGAVATVTLQRPAAMNALDDDTLVELHGALRLASDDTTVRAVVLTGQGRAFCVGQDLREHAGRLAAASSGTAGTGMAGTGMAGTGMAGTGTAGTGTAGFELGDIVRERYNPVTALLSGMPKPVIAAVNGIAAGAGASFAFACDLRILADRAGFTTAFAAIGLSCDSGASWWLPRLVGMARARELLLLPRTVGAQEALRIGLANRVVPDTDLPEAAEQLAAELAAGPTLAYASLKQALAYSAMHDLPDSLGAEAELMALTGRSTDHRHAVDAFLAKTTAGFSGR